MVEIAKENIHTIPQDSELSTWEVKGKLKGYKPTNKRVQITVKPY